MARIGIGTNKDWEAQMDLSTLLEACKIRKDPARMKAVKAEAKKQKDSRLSELTEVGELAEGKDED